MKSRIFGSLQLLTRTSTAILKETADDLGNANSLKERADQAKIKADKMLSTAKQVLGALDEGKKSLSRNRGQPKLKRTHC